MIQAHTGCEVKVKANTQGKLMWRWVKTRLPSLIYLEGQYGGRGLQVLTHSHVWHLCALQPGELSDRTRETLSVPFAPNNLLGTR